MAEERNKEVMYLKPNEMFDCADRLAREEPHFFRRDHPGWDKQAEPQERRENNKEEKRGDP